MSVLYGRLASSNNTLGGPLAASAGVFEKYNSPIASIPAVTTLAGLDTVGSFADNYPAGYSLIWEVTASADGTIGNFVLYTNSTNTATVKVYLYSQGAATPSSDTTGVLLSSTNAIICNGSIGFQPPVSATSASITSGIKYWMVVASKSGGASYYFKANTTKALGYTISGDYFTTPFTHPNDATWGSTSGSAPITGYFTN